MMAMRQQQLSTHYDNEDNHSNRSTNSRTMIDSKRFMYCSITVIGLVLVPFLFFTFSDRNHWNQQNSSISFQQSLSNEKHNSHDQNMHRNLFLLQQDQYCRRTYSVPGESYQTVTVYRLFAWFTLLFNPYDVRGSCGIVCPDVCNHQPCFNDYFSADDTLCECFPTGSFQCSTNAFCDNARDLCTCNPGYEGDPLTGCVDIDECRIGNRCGANGVCVNTPGSYECECDNGYKVTSAGCVDINECVESPPCGSDATCANSIGSYKCTCNSGFSGNPPSVFCSDINECATSAPCGPNSITCINKIGSYSCTCKAGYKDASSTGGGCVNINECTEGGNNCNLISENCVDNAGSFTCNCKSGYTGTAGNCTDVNECSTGTICGPDATCQNTIGNYTCSCNPGFLGGKPPNCRKLNAYEKCPGPNSDCASGLECSVTSRSDSSTSCCPTATAYPCSTTRCCSGAYTEGETCPSRQDIDCRDSLRCAWRSALDGTYVCCSRTIANPLVAGGRICV